MVMMMIRGRRQKKRKWEEEGCTLQTEGHDEVIHAE